MTPVCTRVPFLRDWFVRCELLATGAPAFGRTPCLGWAGSGSAQPASLSSLSGSAELSGEKRRFLQQVERFCGQGGNDWHRVYLVRKLAGQQGMECVQRLCGQGQPAQWVLPQEAVGQQVRTPDLASPLPWLLWPLVSPLWHPEPAARRGGQGVRALLACLLRAERRL